MRQTTHREFLKYRGAFAKSRLTSANHRTKDIRIGAVVISELKFRDVQRHIFGRNFVEAANDAALEDRPETLNRVGVNRTHG